MLRTVFLLSLLYLLPSVAAAQANFTMANTPPDARDAIYISLEDKLRLEGEFHVRTRIMDEYNHIYAPISVGHVVPANGIRLLHQRTESDVFFTYKVSPQLVSQRIGGFQITPNNLQFETNDALRKSVTEKGLTVESNGIYRQVTWNFADGDRQNDPFFGEYRLPDIIALGLPEGSEGRALPGSNSVVSPEPISGTNPLIFDGKSLTNGRIEIAYNLPEPESFRAIVENGLKLVGMLIPVLLLLFTDASELNRKRYRWIFRGTLSAIIIIYAGLIGFGLYIGASILEIIINIAFAFVTGVLAWIVQWTKTKAPSQPLPNVQV